MINHKFSSLFFTIEDHSIFNPKEYFLYFHYFEIYYPCKKYNINEFVHNYGKGYNTYKYCLYIISDSKSCDKIMYIVSEEILLKKEISKLKKYCQCNYHNGNFITKLFIDRCYNDCITVNFGNKSQYNIDNAKVCMNLKENNIN